MFGVTANGRKGARRPHARPTVTVVIPCYNRAELLRQSAMHALSQSFRDLELVIVDDGSSEDLDAALDTVLEDSRAAIFRHDFNRGAAAARNTGVSLARGRYIAFLDSDDAWLASKLERQLAWMQVNGRDISCTGYRLVTRYHPKGELRQLPEVCFADLVSGCSISAGSTMVVERSLFERVGPFDESLRRLEDWEWLLRCAQLTSIGVVPEILAQVQSAPNEACPWAHVRNSAEVICKYARRGRYPLSRRQRRLLHSALHNEVAVAAFRVGRYRSAVWSLAKSYYYHPFKQLDYYRRILRAVAIELLDSVRITKGSSGSG